MLSAASAAPVLSSPLAPAISPVLAGSLLEQVRAAWRSAHRHGEDDHETLRIAAGALAVYARAHGLPLYQVEQALQSLVDPAAGGDASLVWGDVRRHVFGAAHVSYYRDD